MDIGKHFRVITDELNVKLQERYMSKPKDGTPPVEMFKTIGYYTSLADCFKALVDLKVKESGLEDLKTVIAKLDEIYKLIDKAVKEK